MSSLWCSNWIDVDCFLSAAREYYEEHKHEIGWDVVTFLPSLAFGVRSIFLDFPDYRSQTEPASHSRWMCPPQIE